MKTLPNFILIVVTISVVAGTNTAGNLQEVVEEWNRYAAAKNIPQLPAEAIVQVARFHFDQSNEKNGYLLLATSHSAYYYSAITGTEKLPDNKIKFTITRISEATFPDITGAIADYTRHHRSPNTQGTSYHTVYFQNSSSHEPASPGPVIHAMLDAPPRSDQNPVPPTCTPSCWVDEMQETLDADVACICSSMCLAGVIICGYCCC